MRKFIPAMIASLFLSACMTTGQVLPEQGSFFVTSIGVATTFSDKLYATRIGTTVFNNASWTADVPEWRMNEKAFETIQNGLKESITEVVTLKVEQTGDRQATSDKAIEMARAQNLDAVLIIQEHRFDDYSAFTEKFVGAEFFQRSAYGNTAVRCVRVGYIAELHILNSSTVQIYRDTPLPCLRFTGGISAYNFDGKNIWGGLFGGGGLLGGRKTANAIRFRYSSIREIVRLVWAG